LHKLTWLHGLELFVANFDDHIFGRHAHSTFAIGAIVEGVGGYRCRGKDHVLPIGSLSLMNPEEPHTGHSLHGQLRYNMVYVSEEAAANLLNLSVIRGFREISPQDKSHDLARVLGRLSAIFEHPEALPAWKLLVEENIHKLLNIAFFRYGGEKPLKMGREPKAVRQVCEMIDEHVENEDGVELTIKNMAAIVDLHPNYLIQIFTLAKGVPPHNWLLLRKICRSKQLIAEGVPPIEAAFRLGFYDQAHFIKHFRKITGVTPGHLIIH